MKFTCKTSKLKEAIFQVEKIVSKQTTLPVLKNILIEAEKSQLTISATNLEIAIKIVISAKIEKTGKITIPPKIIGGFLSAISDEVISGELEKSELIVESESHKMKIKGINANDFPIIPKNEEDEYFFKLNSQEFAQAISGVFISVAHNDTRQELNGIFFRLKKEQIIMASTDSFRLTEVKLPLNVENITEEYEVFREKNKTLILPIQALANLQRVEDGEVFFFVKQKQVFIKYKNTLIVSRIINGDYPEYTQILPKKHEIEVRVKKDELINAIKIASLITEEQNGEVKIENENNEELTIISQSINTGDNLSKVKAKISGPKFEVFFNHRYLLDGLNSGLFNEEDLVFKLNQHRSPVLFSVVSREDSFSYVIMPIIKD